MKISASILAINQENIKKKLLEKNNLYDLVHIDIADNKFCPTYGISENILNDILEYEEYEVDIHLMMNSLPEFLVNNNIDKTNINMISYHIESPLIHEFLQTMQTNKNIKKGIGILGDTDIRLLKNYLENDNYFIDYVLLLCVNPGFSYQEPIISPIERVKEFKDTYPSYDGFISIDGGVKEYMLTELSELNVEIVVQGGAIFG